MDKKMKTAEQKKMDERRLIRKLRAEFEQLLAEVCPWPGRCLCHCMQNENLDEAARLARSEFEMDPHMRSMMEAQKSARLAQLRDELAWDLEKHKLAHAKLRNRFFGPVDCHRLIVRAFLSPNHVSTLRCPLPSKEFIDMSFRPFMSLSKLKTWQSKAQLAVSKQIAEASGVAEDESSAALLPAPPTQRRESKDAALNRLKLEEALNKAEERKRKRDQRRVEWEALAASKPDEKYINPEDAEVGSPWLAPGSTDGILGHQVCAAQHGRLQAQDQQRLRSARQRAHQHCPQARPAAPVPPRHLQLQGQIQRAH